MSVIPELPGQRVRYARRAAGFSQTELARTIGVPAWWLSDAERSRDNTGRRFDANVRDKLAAVLNINPETLLLNEDVVVFDPQEIGDRIRTARRYRGLTLHRAAVQVGRSGTWFREVEAGDVILSHLMRRKVSEMLDVDPVTFLIAGELHTCGCGCGAQIAPGVRCPLGRSQTWRAWAIEAGQKANRRRSIATGHARVEQLRKLDADNWLDYLLPHHAEALRLATKHPELSIAELGGLADPPVGKDVMASRIRRARETLARLAG